MLQQIHVKPTRPEVKVIDPVSGLELPYEGKNVEPSTWWSRRHRDGDIIISAVKRASRKRGEGK